ncbi:FecR family protein [Parabacteroides chinchillae]
MLQAPEDIIIKCIQKTASEEEFSLLNEWLHEDKKHAELYFQMEEIWDSRNRLDEETIQKGWERLYVQMEATSGKKVLYLQSEKLKLRRWLSYVAAVFIGALIVSVAWFGLQSGTSVTPELVVRNVVYNHTGVQRLILPDSSEVYVNEGSRLIYPEKFNRNQRLVQLEGKAFFNVHKNTDQPFIVQMGNVDVEVTGTEFFINSVPDHFTCVTLISGSVNLNYPDEYGNSSSVKLIPGQEADIDVKTGNITVVDTDTYYYTAWKDGEYQFDNELFEVIADLVAKRFDLEIQASPSLKAKRFTGRVNSDDKIQDVLATIQKSYPIRYEIIGKTIKISE